MARMIELIRDGAVSKIPIGLDVSGVRLDFQPRVRPDGERVVSALISDDHEGIADVLTWARARKAKGLIRIDEREVDAAVAARTVPAVTSAPGDAAAPRSPLARAVMNGWLPEDLAGSGLNGDAGLAGGRGAYSGLTLAEMASSRVPPGWAERRMVAWPWECTDFEPRSANWQAPTMPKKTGTLQMVVQVFGLEAVGRSRAVAERAPAATPSDEASASVPSSAPAPAVRASSEATIPTADTTADSDAGAGAGSTATPSLSSEFTESVLKLAGSENAEARAAGELLLREQASITAEIATVVLKVKPNADGALPVSKIRAQLTRAGLTHPPDPVLQALSLLLRS